MAKKIEIAAAAGGKMPLIIAAEELGNDLKRVDGIAYSGGPFSQYWSNIPCITNLEGMEIAAQIPESPPPHTTNCVSIRTSFTTGEFASVRITLGFGGVICDWLVAISADETSAVQSATTAKTPAPLMKPCLFISLDMFPP